LEICGKKELNYKKWLGEAVFKIGTRIERIERILIAKIN
jgi:hypothetical protein